MSTDGWCLCGLAVNDPLHDGWHKIVWWNRGVLEGAAAQRELEFAQDLEAHDYRHGRTPADPQQTLAVEYRAAGNTYSR